MDLETPMPQTQGFNLHASREGLLAEPTYLPAWAKDLSFLTAFMSYTAELESRPVIWGRGAPCA